MLQTPLSSQCRWLGRRLLQEGLNEKERPQMKAFF
nr:MAG TPA: hypothetical protein [Caudoviricetes sp.]